MFDLNNIYKDFTPSHSLDLSGWFEEDQFVQDLIDNYKPKTIIEVGTWKGKSAIYMAECLKKLSIQSRIFCVDTWTGAAEFWTWASRTSERDLLFKHGMPQVYYQFLSNVVHTSNQEIIYPLPVPSSTGYEIFNYYKIKADLIYIDASHEHTDVLRDITNYSQLLNDSGIIFGDDYNNLSFPGVKRAVEDFLKNNANWKLTLSEKERYWLLTK